MSLVVYESVERSRRVKPVAAAGTGVMRRACCLVDITPYLRHKPGTAGFAMIADATWLGDSAGAQLSADRILFFVSHTHHGPTGIFGVSTHGLWANRCLEAWLANRPADSAALQDLHPQPHLPIDARCSDPTSAVPTGTWTWTYTQVA